MYIDRQKRKRHENFTTKYIKILLKCFKLFQDHANWFPIPQVYGLVKREKNKFIQIQKFYEKYFLFMISKSFKMKNYFIFSNYQFCRDEIMGLVGGRQPQTMKQ